MITEIGGSNDDRSSGSAFEPEQGTAFASSRPIATGLRRGVFGGLAVVVLLTAIGDEPSDSNWRAAPASPEVCTTVSDAQKAETNTAANSSLVPTFGQASSQAPYISVGQLDPETGRYTFYARIDPEEQFWEFCGTSTQLGALGVEPFPDEKNLGELPDGMSYVYLQDQESRGYLVAGVRLRDGSVVDNITLRDGKTLPDVVAATLNAR